MSPVSPAVDSAGECKVGSASATARESRIQIAAWACLSAIALVPFFLTPLPPLNDYPAHLARAHIIHEISRAPELQNFYQVDWMVIPNLALDIIVPFIARLMPIETAMVVFTILTMLLLSSGVIAVNRALFRRVSYAPLVVFLFLYNRQFLWGFLNYLFALGFCLWMFAAWIRFRHKPAGWRAAAFAVPAFVLFIFHLHALATYAVLIAGAELHYMSLTIKLDWRKGVMNMAAGAAQFVAPVLALVWFSPTVDRAGEIEFGGVLWKVAGVVDAFHLYYLPFAFFLIAVAFALVALGIAHRSLVLHHRLVIPVIALTLLYLAMPARLFGSLGADRRLATSIFFIVAASIFWRSRRKAVDQMICVVLCAVFLTRVGLIGWHWLEAGRQYTVMLAALEKVETGSRLAAAVAKLESPFLEDPPTMYFAGMAVVRRNAFVNSLFADPGHQPLRLRYLPADVSEEQLPHVFFVQQQGPEEEWSAPEPFDRIVAEEYDYFLLLNPQYFHGAIPAGLKEIAAEENRFVLYGKTDSASAREAFGADTARILASAGPYNEPGLSVLECLSLSRYSFRGGHAALSWSRPDPAHRFVSCTVVGKMADSVKTLRREVPYV